MSEDKKNNSKQYKAVRRDTIIQTNNKMDRMFAELALTFDKDLQKEKVQEFDAISGEVMKALIQMIPVGGKPTLIVRFGGAVILASSENKTFDIKKVIHETLGSIPDDEDTSAINRRKIENDE